MEWAAKTEVEKEQIKLKKKAQNSLPPLDFYMDFSSSDYETEYETRSPPLRRDLLKQDSLTQQIQLGNKFLRNVKKVRPNKKYPRLNCNLIASHSIVDGEQLSNPEEQH